MTRHLITKTLLAASALTVLAAAPSAMAASNNTIKAKVKKSQSFKKVASNKFRNSRINTSRTLNTNNRSNRNISSFNRNNRSRSLNVRSSRLFGSVASPSFRNRGFSSSYRSSFGISFNFGSPGYSRYRWSPSAYSLYRPSYGSYGSYQTRTSCRRVTLDGWYHGHRELISVEQCSNPWDGTYIIQGSERVANSRW